MSYDSSQYRGTDDSLWKLNLSGLLCGCLHQLTGLPTTVCCCFSFWLLSSHDSRLISYTPLVHFLQPKSKDRHSVHFVADLILNQCSIFKLYMWLGRFCDSDRQTTLLIHFGGARVKLTSTSIFLVLQYCFLFVSLLNMISCVTGSSTNLPNMKMTTYAFPNCLDFFSKESKHFGLWLFDL